MPESAPARPTLRARLAERVRVRREAFGSVVYVGRRDHFFALDHQHTSVLARLDSSPRPVAADGRERVVALAELGIVTTDPPTAERPFYGRSLVGSLTDVPVAWAKPLLVNCFVTAHCALRCVYCHADDLMVNYRGDEDARWLDEVVRVARATPAMVAVVTGGEPLARPDRTERLIRALARDKAVVLDTSGVGDFHRLMPLLDRYGVHVRVSLDSAERRVNDSLRPINRRYLPPGISAFAHATDTIRKAVRRGLACSVQTVVTSRNDTLESLTELRDLLVELGIRTWAVHVVVPAGKAAGRHGSSLLPGSGTVGTLQELVRRSAARSVEIDIRVTSTHRTPNSTLLISAKGELCVEGPTGAGKTTLTIPRLFARRTVLRQFRTRVDPAGHASRYLNGTLPVYSAGQH